MRPEAKKCVFSSKTPGFLPGQPNYSGQPYLPGLTRKSHISANFWLAGEIFLFFLIFLKNCS